MNHTSNHLIFPVYNKNFVNYLDLIAMALITASFLYLVAANWFMIPSLFRMLIPMLILLIVSGISTLPKWSETIRHALHTVCGILIGLIFASIGQIYQTGADSYQLFTLWSLLLSPWVCVDLLSHKVQKTSTNTGIFVLWGIISHLALGLYFKQTFLFGNNEGSFTWVYVCLMNLLTMVQFLLAVNFYRKSRFIMIAGIALISICSSIALIVSNKHLPFFSLKQISFAVSVFLMSGLSIAHFYHRKQQLETVLSVTGLSLAIMLYLLYLIIDHSFNNLGSMSLISAIVVFAEFAFLAFLFSKLFKNQQISNIKSHQEVKAKSTNYHIILLAIGAWIAGLIFADFMLLTWGWFSLIAGIGSLIAGVALINTDHDFSRHLGYCLTIAGQTAAIFHITNEFHSMYVLLPIQIILFIGLMMAIKKPHWIYVTLQIVGSYCAFFAFGWQLFEDIFDIREFALVAFLILNYSFYAILHWLGNHYFKEYHRSIVMAVLIVIAGTLWIYPELIEYLNQNSIPIKLISYVLAFIWLGYFLYRFQRSLPIISLFTMIILASVLIIFGYFEIFIILMIMAWALNTDSSSTEIHHQEVRPINDKLMFVLAMIVLSWSIWQLYYHLHISFLYKSLTIFISGIVLFGFTKVLKNTLSITPSVNKIDY